MIYDKCHIKSNSQYAGQCQIIHKKLQTVVWFLATGLKKTTKKKHLSTDSSTRIVFLSSHFLLAFNGFPDLTDSEVLQTIEANSREKKGRIPYLGCGKNLPEIERWIQPVSPK